MQLETERLILRELTLEDLDALYEVLGDPENMRYYPYRFDRDRVQAWIARNLERYRMFGFGLWAVLRKDTGQLIGDCGITMQEIKDSIRPEIGYHIHRQHQRKGYAKEAAAACRDWGFTHTPFGMLYAYMKQGNAASAATAMAIGMKPAGTFTDRAGEQSRIYAITREEWRTLRKMG